ncbi:MAG: hypothetical protein O9270_14375 [Aquidulcibacter sp.]|jgi:lincosamide nucleotidyltransferase|uniref:hypothetical protein n=1 Tax=Aquidulcibacter sp. TaxID=2052990 RepID=UPI0022BCA73B|nr:hypothetical protein [Aquidulcibacter sp.]MCE2892115.1 hypothetical protein [Hyphomonadaceae bacterium]MCZ8209365.1 hypothetical protein [Aquidulcibacter sp.]
MSDFTIGPAVQRLLDRLDAIAASLAQKDGTLALLGLGSVGLDIARADRYSDLDFFVVAEPSTVHRLRDQLAWLSAVNPLVFAHRNTADGWKILFEDGIFAEFAVFSQEQLPHIPFQAGRLVWARAGFDTNVLAPIRQADQTNVAWAVVEALTCLYVGLGRFWRGERLAAQRMIQGNALDLVLKIMRVDEHAGPGADPFDPSRRVEQIWPDRREWLKQACAGYGYSLEAAQILLTELRRFGPLPSALVAAIEALLHAPTLKDDDAAF